MEPRTLRFSASRISWRRGSFPTGPRCGILIFRRCLIFEFQRERLKFGGFHLSTAVFGSGRVPHVRPSVHGPKTDFSNAFTPCATILALRRSLFCPRSRSLGRGCAPSFSAHVRWGEHGAPVQRSGPCCLLKSRAAHLFKAVTVSLRKLSQILCYINQSAEQRNRSSPAISMVAQDSPSTSPSACTAIAGL